MKYFSDFSISYRRVSLSMARVSGFKATKSVLKAGQSNLKCGEPRWLWRMAGGANHLQSLFHELWSVDGDTAISGGCVLFACDKKGALGLGLYSALLLKRVFIFPRLARFGCDQAVVRAA